MDRLLVFCIVRVIPATGGTLAAADRWGQVLMTLPPAAGGLAATGGAKLMHTN